MTTNTFINTESHNLIVSSWGRVLLTIRSQQMASLSHDSTAGDELIDEHYRGDNQQ
jgi:hypothetical protein